MYVSAGSLITVSVTVAVTALLVESLFFHPVSETPLSIAVALVLVGKVVGVETGGWGLQDAQETALKQTESCLSRM